MQFDPANTHAYKFLVTNDNKENGTFFRTFDSINEVNTSFVNIVHHIHVNLNDDNNIKLEKCPGCGRGV
jgi:hypothetical protein